MKEVVDPWKKVCEDCWKERKAITNSMDKKYVEIFPHYPKVEK